MKRYLMVLMVIGLIVGSVATADAKEPNLRVGPPSESQPLLWLQDPDGDGPVAIGDPVHNSEAAIWRDKTGISFRIRTSGLTDGYGYTVWFFSYDNPAACQGGNGQPGSRCTRLDLLANPAALGSLMWGRAGEFVNGSGTTIFTGHRPVNTLPCVTEPAVITEDCGGVLLGRGLSNPMGAEIHFVIRNHGPDQQGIDDETTTINGGCDPLTYHGLPGFGPGWGTPGNYACSDPQGNGV